jgi:hypothetical protein
MTKTAPKPAPASKKQAAAAPAKPADRPAPTPAAGAPASLAGELDWLLDSFADQHEELLRHTQSQRDAIRKADGSAVQSASDGQTEVVAALGRLEQRRRELVASACQRYAALATKRTTDITLTDLARCVDEPQRSALVRKANDLKALIASVHQQTSTIKSATTSLLAHMEGLMRQVGRQLSHAGTYSSRGYVEPGGIVVSALDVAT